MFSKEIEQEKIKKDIQYKLSVDYGFGNVSKSSIATQIADAISGPVADVINTTNTTLNSMYTSTATGELLTANAYDYGVIRNAYSEVYLSDEDNAVKISMDDGSVFPDYFNNAVIIPSGTEFVMPNSSVIQITKDVYLSPGMTEDYVSVKVSSPSATDIVTGTSISVSDSSRPITNGLSIQFSYPVNFKLRVETDDELRQRTQLAKIKVHGSNELAVMSFVFSTPTIIDAKMFYDDNNNTNRIFIVTSNYKNNLTDPNAVGVVSSIKNKLDSYIGVESKFSVDFPEIYSVSFLCRYSNATVSMARKVLQSVFDSIYSYSTNKSINVDAFKTEIKKTGIDVRLENIVLSHSVYGIIGTYESGDVSIPDTGMAALDLTSTFFIED